MFIYTFKIPSFSLIPTMLIYFIIFVVSYVSLAWYDYYYGCSQLPLQRSKVSFTSQFKPPVYDEERQTEHMFSQKELDKNNKTIYALHLLLIVPFISYIGLKQGKVDPRFYNLLLALAGFTAVYHGFRLVSTSH